MIPSKHVFQIASMSESTDIFSKYQLEIVRLALEGWLQLTIKNETLANLRILRDEFKKAGYEVVLCPGLPSGIHREVVEPYLIVRWYY